MMRCFKARDKVLESDVISTDISKSECRAHIVLEN
jgi:hypothetical protein